MSVRPNIESLVLTGTDLKILGETDDEHFPVAIFVVVTQDNAAGAAQLRASGIADRVGSGWQATIKNTPLQKGPAETMGVQIHVDPFQCTSWVQSLPIT
jgi:hypothetical protein